MPLVAFNFKTYNNNERNNETKRKKKGTGK